MKNCYNHSWFKVVSQPGQAGVHLVKPANEPVKQNDQLKCVQKQLETSLGWFEMVVQDFVT